MITCKILIFAFVADLQILDCVKIIPKSFVSRDEKKYLLMFIYQTIQIYRLNNSQFSRNIALIGELMKMFEFKDVRCQ